VPGRKIVQDRDAMQNTNVYLKLPVLGIVKACAYLMDCRTRAIG
jgi:hypothetical protein